jgi:hypothetical protein
MDISGNTIWSLVLPNGVKHISGLAYIDESLFAANYDDGIIYIYQLDNDDSPKVTFVDSINTNLKGLSALAYINIEGRDFLGVSDFGLFKKTYIVSVEKFLKGNTFKDATVYSYRNKNFSQGLAYRDNKLYESCNRLGVDDIFVYDIHYQDNGIKMELSGKIKAPWKMVEDMDFIDNYLYTSDEDSFEIYKLEINN